MKLLLYLSIIWISFDVFMSDQVCKKGYFRVTNYCYIRSTSFAKYTSPTKSWYDAKSFCESIGDTLIGPIYDANSEEIIFGTQDTPFKDDFWIGVYSDASQKLHWQYEVGYIPDTTAQQYWGDTYTPEADACVYVSILKNGPLFAPSCYSNNYFYCMSPLQNVFDNNQVYEYTEYKTDAQTNQKYNSIMEYHKNRYEVYVPAESYEKSSEYKKYNPTVGYNTHSEYYVDKNYGPAEKYKQSEKHSEYKKPYLSEHYNTNSEYFTSRGFDVFAPAENYPSKPTEYKKSYSSIYNQPSEQYPNSEHKTYQYKKY